MPIRYTRVKSPWEKTVEKEPKPRWQDVPESVKDAIERRLGERVVAGRRVYGGYGPSTTLRLHLAGGRSVFVKGAGAGSNDHIWRVVPEEERIYREVPAIRPFAPAYLGTVLAPGWHLILLEDLKGTRSLPPWTKAAARTVMADLARLHLALRPHATRFRPWEAEAFAANWAKVGPGGEDRAHVATLFADGRAALGWLERALPEFVRAEAGIRTTPVRGAIHSDVRSDNLRLRRGHLVLFDWASASHGPLAFEPVAFLPSVAAEGGPPPGALLPVYREAMAKGGVEILEADIRASVSAVAGYFASRAGRPPMAGLPRLRRVQRQQFRFALPWAARLVLGEEAPPLREDA